jgi:vancomycin resistance protein YoaR
LKTKTKQNLIIIGLGVVGILSLYLTVALGYFFSHQNTIYPGVSAAGIDLSGKTKAEAIKAIEAKESTFLGQKIDFTSEKPVLVTASDLGIKLDAETTTKNAYRAGHSNPFIIGKKQNVPVVFTYDKTALNRTIDSAAAKLNTTVSPSTLKKQGSEITVVSGQPGQKVNYAETSHNFQESVGQLDNRVVVKAFTVTPTFSAADLAAKKAEIEKISQNKLTLKTTRGNFEVTPEKILSWIQLNPEEPIGSNFYGDKLMEPLAEKNGSLLSYDLVSSYLTNLSDKINQNPVNAQLSINGGRANVFVPSKDGLTLNIPASVEKIAQALEDGETEADLVVETKKAEVNEASLNDLGINELISTGYSSFAGSPANRIHNLRTGAAKFNGVLIKPDEVFSFNTTLGPVDASTGYLPELVIVENKTEPQYGGGMCQVSSTAFRAALNAGLPIVERRYHAYPVQYYKPYGVDATIYLPKPDLVFKNDTGHYVLIQTHIEGTKLTFDFYGTKPNRSVKFAGNEAGNGAVGIVEQVTPAIYDQEARGRGSFTAQFWRFIYDAAGNLVTKSTWVSKYDSPDKYPH